MIWLSEKPEHNKYDNIWEIRKKGNLVLTKTMNRLEPRRLKFYEARDPETFLWAIIKSQSFHLPIWKVVVPNLDEPRTMSGAIYYIVRLVKDERKKMVMFRGTFNYGGSGPHQSALIEEYLSAVNYPIEVRSADYLLGMLE